MGVLVLVLDDTWPALPASVGRARSAVGSAAVQAGIADGLVHNLKVAVSEAATNAILHAYRGDRQPEGVHVLVQRAEERLDVRIRDRGVGMSPRPDSPGLGMGLSLMAHEAEHFEIRAAPQGGTEVVLHFKLD